MSLLATPKISKQLDFLILIHFPFLTPLADLVASLPAISQFYQFTITCKRTPLLRLILAELIFTLFKGTPEGPDKIPEVLLARGGRGQ